MATDHRPDFRAYKIESDGQRQTGTRYRDSYLFPHINLEDLLKPRILLPLLQTRARNPPNVFFEIDKRTPSLGFATDAIKSPVLEGYGIFVSDCPTAEEYITLEIEDGEETSGLQPGFALLILDMQQSILRFLVECCRKIMHDIPLDRLTAGEHPVLPTVSLLRVSDSDGFASLAEIAAETPYRAPASPDLARLETLFAAHVRSLEDHIWFMREDPAYFVDTLVELREHGVEMLKDRNGKVHPLLKSDPNDTVWKNVVMYVIAKAYYNLEIWTMLHTQVKDLLALESKHSALISRTRELCDFPQDFLDALAKLRWHLHFAKDEHLGRLRLFAPGSPPLRPFFFQVPPGEISTETEVVRKNGQKLAKPQEEFLWLLTTLREYVKRMPRFGLENMVDELGRLIPCEPKVKDMITSYVETAVLDLTLICEGRKQILNYNPCPAALERLLVGRDPAITQEFNAASEEWLGVFPAFDGESLDQIARLADISESKFYYPVKKRRSRENVEAMRSAERNLDIFWQTVDENMKSAAGEKVVATAFGRHLRDPREMQRTAEWAESEDKSSSLPQRGSQGGVESIRNPLSDFYFDAQYRAEGTSDRASRDTQALKNKAKTRGVPNHREVPDANLPPSAVPDIQPTLAVDAKALKVFRTLFYTPTVSGTPGQVAWTDFLHAMVSTGFDVEKLYGSVWQFSPRKLYVERSIQFHKPHPSGKIPYKTARRFGRRLEGAYGWFGDMFALAE